MNKIELSIKSAETAPKDGSTILIIVPRIDMSRPHIWMCVPAEWDGDSQLFRAGLSLSDGGSWSSYYSADNLLGWAELPRTEVFKTLDEREADVIERIQVLSEKTGESFSELFARLESSF